MLQRARIDPYGIIRFFTRLKQESSGQSAILPYLSTHPATSKRIELLKGMAGEAGETPEPLMTCDEWKEAMQGCRGARRPHGACARSGSPHTLVDVLCAGLALLH